MLNIFSLSYRKHRYDVRPSVRLSVCPTVVTAPRINSPSLYRAIINFWSERARVEATAPSARSAFLPPLLIAARKLNSASDSSL